MKQLLAILATTALFLFPIIVRAQTYQPSNRSPVTDNSQIGTQVSGANKNFNITGGLQRGHNLFHSFTDFSVPTGGSANFINPAATQSIITRVTGNNFSDINGLVNTNGANFLLINPNGVVFGSGVSLDVAKAFVTSTASGVDFVDAAGKNYNFGVNRSGDIPLLSIDPKVAFNPAQLIMNASIPGSKGIENNGTLRTTNPGQYIGLIGGNVSFNGGQIIAPGAKVELGGLAQSGTVGFSVENGLKFPANVERGNVSLVSIGTSPSIIDVRSSGGGSVGMVAKDITIQGTGGRIIAGIAAGLGNPTATAGDITLNATGDVRLSDGASIRNRVNLGAQGKSGEIEIVAANLSVSNGGRLVAGTAGKGDAGNIKITATGNVSFDGVQNNLPSVAFNVVDKGAEGKGGSIEIVAGNISITNEAALVAGTLGKGDAGNIKITATDNISFDGGAALVDSGKEAEGKGGRIEIAANNLSVSNGAAFQSSTDGKGDAGNIKIQVAKNVSFDNGYVFNNVNPDAQGNGGTIEIAASNVFFTNSGQLTASTYGKGNAGNIKITATGNVSFDGRNEGFSSSALSKVNKGAEGKGGTISIVAENLSITNGGDLQAATYGKGDAGNIKITATGNVSIDNSSVFSRVEQNAIGKGGEIEIVTQNLFATNGGQLTASTYGKGDAGNIKITATGKVSFDGRKNSFSSAAFSTVEQDAQGKGGAIEIKTGSLSVTNGAKLTASTSGQGSAGDILLKSNFISLNKGEILSKSTSSTGGNINITTNDFLLLRNDSIIATDSKSTNKNGNGGNITINSPLIVALPGNNDITANANQGNGGSVKIDSQGLFGIKYRLQGSPLTNDITASSTFGQSGSVQINTPGTDPGKNNGELAETPNDASKQISQACGASQRDNKFYITGRGGLPPTAIEALESEALWEDARAVNTKPTLTTTQPQQFASPAVGWVFEQNGRVRLIAAQTGVGATGNSVACPK